MAKSPPSQRPTSSPPAGEFDFIATHLRPLARNAPGALNLTDDVAILPLNTQNWPQEGTQDATQNPSHPADITAPGTPGAVVVSADMLVEGTHVLPDTAPELLAQKALAVNVSDILAKGATPFGYLLSLALPKTYGDQHRAAFAKGLALAQAEHGLTLLGGDTTSTAGPLTLSITIFGHAGPRGPILRSGAQPGDDVWVTGTIGDGWLGLQECLGQDHRTAQNKDKNISKAQSIAALAKTSGQSSRHAYELPRPAAWARHGVATHAHASIDISDGLLADLCHIAQASDTAIALDLDVIPLSDFAKTWLSQGHDQTDSLLTLATGGDDYQIAVTAPPSARDHLDAIRPCEPHGTKPAFTRIGRVIAQPDQSPQHPGGRLRLFYHGQRIPLPDGLGFSHF